MKIYRPGPHQTMLLLAAADEVAVERHLRPQLGARLCVIPSRWTKAQLDHATSVLLEHMAEWLLITFGLAADEQGQRAIFTRLVRVLPGMAQWAADVPDGLLKMNPVLAPAAS